MLGYILSTNNGNVEVVFDSSSDCFKFTMDGELLFTISKENSIDFFEVGFKVKDHFHPYRNTELLLKEIGDEKEVAND